MHDVILKLHFNETNLSVIWAVFRQPSSLRASQPYSWIAQIACYSDLFSNKKFKGFVVRTRNDMPDWSYNKEEVKFKAKQLDKDNLPEMSENEKKWAVR